MRKRIHEIIALARSGDRLSHFYDVFMLFVIVVSLAPLAIKEPPLWCTYVEIVTSCIFVVDYILHLITADLSLKRGWLSFLLFPITPLAIIDILSILPTLFTINEALRALKIFRLIRALRVLKFFKSFRYSRNILIIGKVFKRQKHSLLTVGYLAVGYILVSALVIFNIEPDTFPTFLDAVYWATVSLTTVGYGDICPHTEAGKIITMLSSVIGIAVIALPSGIITAAYLTELKRENDDFSGDDDAERQEKSE